MILSEKSVSWNKTQTTTDKELYAAGMDAQSSTDILMYLLNSLQAEAYCKHDPRICQVIWQILQVLYLQVSCRSIKTFGGSLSGKALCQVFSKGETAPAADFSDGGV